MRGVWMRLLDVVDLLPYFADVDLRRLAVEPFTDPHPNELGHRLIAEALLEQLLTRRVFP